MICRNSKQTIAINYTSKFMRNHKSMPRILTAIFLSLIPNYVEAATVTVGRASSSVPTLGEYSAMLLILLMVGIGLRAAGKLSPATLAPAILLIVTFQVQAANTPHRNPSGDYVNDLTSVGNPVYTLKDVSSATTYTGSVSSNGDYVFTGVPVGAYYLIGTLSSQAPQIVIPIATDSDSIAVGARIHRDTRDIDEDNDTDEYSLSGYISEGDDFNHYGNRWSSTGTETKSIKKVHASDSTVNLPSGITINGTPAATYTYFDIDDDNILGETTGDRTSKIDIDDDMSEFETDVNHDVDGNGSIEDIDDDIDDDGIANALDDDIDGDGSDNDEDDDDDGDGTNDSEDDDDDGDGEADSDSESDSD